MLYVTKAWEHEIQDAADDCQRQRKGWESTLELSRLLVNFQYFEALLRSPVLPSDDYLKPKDTNRIRP
jgi:hypothetical protein